jgi:UDPglucose--hexose-1-phosphate uridylyltransferase
VHAQPFVNHGRAAGASLPHPHAQLVVLGVVPPRVELLLDRCRDADRDLVRDAITEARRGPNVVADGPAVAWCPDASWSPYLVRCALEDTGARFDEVDDDKMRAVATTVRDVVAAQRRVLGDVAYNVVIETAPVCDSRRFHWWVDVVPRLTVLAGFELGTGLFVNVFAPEAAAAALRGDA